MSNSRVALSYDWSDSDHVIQLYVALDNTGNNNTTCKTIQEIHTRRGLMWKSDEQQLLYVRLFSYIFLTLKNP